MRDLRPAIACAKENADIIELRLDYLEDEPPEAALQELLAIVLREQETLPFIFTLRPVEQGGRRAIDLSERLSFWHSFGSLLGQHPVSSKNGELFDLSQDARRCFADIELDLLAGSGEQFNLNWNRVICSYHDFAGVPTSLDQIYERMARTPARILKIAVRASSITDCLAINHLLERARREEREIIAIAMGEAGLLTRLLAPSRGAFLTYGAINTQHRSAPGQTSADSLRNLYRVKAIDEKTEIMGLVGSPVAHSLSPHMHNRAFAVCGINAVYIPFEVSDIDEFMRRMVHPRTRELNWNLRGLSVTAPHKSAGFKHLDRIEPAAREIGAINTVVIKDDAVYGYNTDAEAALAPLRNRIALSNARVAVIGAGGASRAVLWSLRRAGAQATVFARRIERARQVADKFDVQYVPLEGAHFGGFDVVINTTPLGTRGPLENDSPATANQLRGARIVYDLVYNPLETRLMREAQAAGCVSVGGLTMLARQAAAQFKLWTNREAPFEAMHEAAERQLLDK